MEQEMEELVLQLFEKNVVRFGCFRLKSGIDSPFYVDLRLVVSYPKLLSLVGEVLYRTMVDNGVDADCLCGVPYAALPFTTCISTSHNIPMLMRRKEVKAHGTKRAIEGEVKPHSKCLIVEDVVSTGGSILETAEVLRSESLVVDDAIVLLDREQGGTKNLKGQGIRLLSALSVHEMLDILEGRGKITSEDAQTVRDYLKGTGPPIRVPKRMLSFSQRADQSLNPVASRLLRIMDLKKSNLAFSADVKTSRELLQLADKTGPHICLLKTHVDTLPDFSLDIAKQLSSLAEQHNFIIMEDRKFADIGNTCRMQYNSVHYHLNVGWAHLVTAHALPGPGVIQALKEVSPSGSGCVLVVEMSSDGSLAVSDYVQSAVKMAEENSDFVAGIVCQRRLSDKLIHMTPGVNMSASKDSLGQQYNSPNQVIGKQLTDLIIVGRGIYLSDDPGEKAKEYREIAYSVYTESLHESCINS